MPRVCRCAPAAERRATAGPAATLGPPRHAAKSKSGCGGPRDLCTALDERDRRGAIRRLHEGVFYSARHRADFFFVTLEKSEEDYSPTTLYNDYPVSPTRFHWETQSNTHAQTEVGRRYVNHERDGNEVALFIRRRRKDERGITLPYVCLGTCRYVEHQGERPMQVIWELASPMPSWLYQEVKVAAG